MEARTHLDVLFIHYESYFLTREKTHFDYEKNLYMCLPAFHFGLIHLQVISSFISNNETIKTNVYSCKLSKRE